MYHTFNEGKAVVVERFNRTLKNIMWKHFTAKNTNKYQGVLPSILEKYNNTFHRTIKMTPKEASQKTNTGRVYFNSLKDKKTRIIPKFKPNDQERISKYKRKFENWTEEIFVVDKVNMTYPVTNNLKDLKTKMILGSLCQQELARAKQKYLGSKR